jgi:hypothetical protein
METLNSIQIARQELQTIANKLGLPIEDETVFKKLVGQSKSVTYEVHREVFAPLYFTKGLFLSSHKSCRAGS